MINNRIMLLRAFSRGEDKLHVILSRQEVLQITWTLRLTVLNQIFMLYFYRKLMSLRKKIRVMIYI